MFNAIYRRFYLILFCLTLISCREVIDYADFKVEVSPHDLKALKIPSKHITSNGLVEIHRVRIVSKKRFILITWRDFEGSGNYSVLQKELLKLCKDEIFH